MKTCRSVITCGKVHRLKNYILIARNTFFVFKGIVNKIKAIRLWRLRLLSLFSISYPGMSSWEQKLLSPVEKYF
ncbi:hypothetical protein Lfee_1291 [Legionella feeleii]|uniref:Uncharacterized protein n=1 Tax=Legionella feeleii TaxID=453 RepID=A0A0W0TWK0_9GAMM|nr:hypothetical protein Lfee_1291 [Legionella feeleii]SPX62780.1 Uncharacterised protein [Legionella feeleii]